MVLEKLTKWNGTVHAPITPGEYTQLTGRAGRRGIDAAVRRHGLRSERRDQIDEILGVGALGPRGLGLAIGDDRAVVDPARVSACLQITHFMTFSF